MSVGLEAAGFEVVAAVELDPIHSSVHHFNFPHSATICSDIVGLTDESVRHRIQEKGYEPSVDVIIGGPPCQGFSQIGKRQLDDPRNRLVFEYVRFVKEFKPSYFVFENVPGIMSGRHAVFVEELAEEFDQIGYNCTYPPSLLDASSFGVAQNRKRVVIIGSRKDVAQCGYPHPTNEERSNGQTELGLATFQPIVTAGQVLSDLQDHEPYHRNDLGIEMGDRKYHGVLQDFSPVPSGRFQFCHTRPNIDRIWNHVGSKHTEVSIERFGATPQGKTEPISRFFKLHPDKPCHTLRAGTASDRGAYTAPRPIHYDYPRCISVREAARLHSFPDWFQFHRTVWHGFREIGNAVAPFLAKAIGDQLIERMERKGSGLPTRTLPKSDPRLLSVNMTEAASFFGVDRETIPTRKRIPPTNGQAE